MTLALSSGPARFVQETNELRRVLRLPRRAWADETADDLAVRMTAALRTPGGTMQLRPIQAIALYEIGTVGGCLISARVGAGKTIVSLLAPYVLASRRPMLLLPARLIDKTRREWSRLREHWLIPNTIRIESYELLGRVSAAQMLADYAPDLIVADECQRVKNPRAACTARLMRYLLANHACRFVAMSGTVTARSLRDYAHLAARCLRVKSAPLPDSWGELEDWAEAIDVKILRDGEEPERKVQTGALEFLCNAEEKNEARHDPVGACRKAYRRRLVETPGVVATSDRFLGASLSVSGIEPRMGEPTNLAFKHLRHAWKLPDDHPLSDGVEVWRHARQLALGFFYAWTPRPPEEWMNRRRIWSAVSRVILRTNRRDLDTALQVANAVDAGFYDDWIEIADGTRHLPAGALERWRDIRDSFEPRSVATWLDTGALEAAAAWARDPGIVWTEHCAFAEALSKMTGLPYYGEQGRDDRTGLAIEQADPKRACIASIKANSEGRNLQEIWSRNLVTSPPKLGLVWEQLLGRTHRDGQTADEVTCDVFVTCQEHAAAWAQALVDAQWIEDSTGQEQKILHVDTDMPANHWR